MYQYYDGMWSVELPITFTKQKEIGKFVIEGVI